MLLHFTFDEKKFSAESCDEINAYKGTEVPNQE